MTTTPIEKFNINECEMIDGKTRVKAYTDIYLDPENPTGIILDTTWGKVHLDLKDIVKSGETITHLKLSPEDDPTVIRYEREDGGIDCITGEELSRIIYLRYLADVEQGHTLQNGEVLMYNSSSDTFNYYNLPAALADITASIAALQVAINNLNTTVSSLSTRVGTLETTVSNLSTRVGNLETTVSNHGTRLTTIETKLTPPTGAPTGVGVAFGNINLYSDVNYTGSNTLNKTKGFYTHNLSTSVTGDEVFS